MLENYESGAKEIVERPLKHFRGKGTITSKIKFQDERGNHPDIRPHA
tara:strand:- start:26 stop:166 length:141 start_codon:yes stop_codon:yes gene_type:complete